jgi:hypothetical protein
MMSNLFVHVVEVLESVVKDEIVRKEAYEILVTAFSAEGYDDSDFSEALELDPVLDAVLEDYIDERNLLDGGFDDLDD